MYILTPLISIAFFICFWEFMSHSDPHWQLLFPPPSMIATRLYQGVDRFYLHTLATLKVMTGGMVLAILAAFPLAWLMLRWRGFACLQPLLVMLQALPMFALAPLMIFWFDWSYTAIVIPTALMIFFPLTVAVYRGFSSTPTPLIDYFRLHSATEMQILLKLRLPWALPSTLSGLRISAAAAGLGAVAGEFAGAQEGLGVLMLESRRGADFTTTFAALACLIGLNLTFYALTLILEKALTTRWRLTRLALVSISFLTLLSSCGSSSQSPQEIRLMLDWVPNPNHVPIYAGISKGFFEEQGLHVRVLKLQDASDVFPYLSSGQADLGIGYMYHLVEAQKRGMDVRTVAYLVKQPLNSLIFRKDSGIQSIQDLHGRTISYLPDDLLQASLEKLLRDNGVIPAAKVCVGFDLTMALAMNKVDVIYGAFWNIEGEQLRSLGIDTDHFVVTELGMPTYFELIFMARGDFLERQPEMGRAVKSALDRSIAFCQAYPDEAFQLYLDANPDKSLTTKDWECRSWELTRPLLAQNQEDEPEVWGAYVEWRCSLDHH